MFNHDQSKSSDNNGIGCVGDIAFRSAETLLSSKFYPVLREKLDKGELDSIEKKPIVVCDINPDMLQVGRQRAPSVIGAKNADMVSNSDRTRKYSFRS